MKLRFLDFLSDLAVFSTFVLVLINSQLTRHTIDTLNMREDVRGVLMTEEFKI